MGTLFLMPCAPRSLLELNFLRFQQPLLRNLVFYHVKNVTENASIIEPVQQKSLAALVLFNLRIP